MKTMYAKIIAVLTLATLSGFVHAQQNSVSGKGIEVDCLEVDHRLQSVILQAYATRCFVFEKGISACKNRMKETYDMLSETPGFQPLSHELVPLKPEDTKMEWVSLQEGAHYSFQCFEYPNNRNQGVMIMIVTK